ncbi:MAG: hypothetical protein ACRC62_15355 [Microcoleus sp.]
MVADMRHSDRYYEDLKKMRRKHPPSKGHSFHHFHYRHLKTRYSIYLVDGINLPQWLHVPIVHRLLGGGDRAGTQLFGKFPNPAQRAFHWLCRLVYLAPLLLICWGLVLILF